ncbi:MAG: hypothetical protein NWE76_01955 [Candidatus Bathyarchaeota archaeon]|nr:hypothetical protein [Candidatus Bathyarchaeota archaeon]
MADWLPGTWPSVPMEPIDRAHEWKMIAEILRRERDDLRRAIDRHAWEREQHGGIERSYDAVLMSKRKVLEAENAN